MAKMAILYSNKDTADAATNIINKQFDFHKVSTGKSSDGYYTVMCSFGFLNKRPQEKVRDVVDVLGLDNSPDVVDYGQTKSGLIQQITIENIDSHGHSMSY